MAETEVTHSETWTLVIRPGEGEDPWPVIGVPGLHRGQRMRPGVARVTLRRGQDGPHVRLAGQAILKDDSVGVRRVVVTVYQPIEWLTEIIEHERTRLQLGPGRTGVGW